ncbi:DNA-binding protein [Actinomadura sp. NBRC 104412]|uniref:helix-turn-helix transcriptional regulator n=1 Tax=Actinomadura sp. NBRC 104412 TaxID=3032203 RepID=UPI0024A09D5D|nr:helix-turn-helix transcriptional regulator [Actinomadura sp. NBRC 104412]GLZ08918.1 DNA-binding protein [Actinomadura sp. NBRC 104412]
MGVAEDTVARNRALQTEWYGEPLGERFRRLLDRLGLSQSGLAGVLGLSAPMLSQLMSAQRAKISNPSVLHRLAAVEELAADPGFDALSPADVKERLRRIRGETAATTSGGVRVSSERVPVESPARVLQSLLRAVASANEIEGAAELIDAYYPELAEVLRVYGNGRTSEAEDHLARTLGR